MYLKFYGLRETPFSPTPDPKFLVSAGIGGIWNIAQGSRFEIYWGQRLNHVQNPKENLQDYGVHLQLVVQAF